MSTIPRSVASLTGSFEIIERLEAGSSSTDPIFTLATEDMRERAFAEYSFVFPTPSTLSTESSNEQGVVEALIKVRMLIKVIHLSV